MLRRHAENILAAAAAKNSAVKLPLATGTGTGAVSTAGLFPVCSLPMTPYLMAGAVVSGGVALNLTNRSSQPDEPRSANTADDDEVAAGEKLFTYVLLNISFRVTEPPLVRGPTE